jgi:hypothetical protein
VGLRTYMAERHDERVVLATVDVFNECMEADWPSLASFSEAVNAAEQFGLSTRARVMIAEYPPIRYVIETNPEELEVRAFVLGLDLSPARF